MIAHGCRQRGRLLAYHEGDLSRAHRMELEAHLRECGQCRTLLRKLEETDTLLLASRPSAAPLPPAVSQALLQEALTRSGARSRPRCWGMWSFAASLGCLLAFSTAAIHRAVPGPRPEPPTVTASALPVSPLPRPTQAPDPTRQAAVHLAQFVDSERPVSAHVVRKRRVPGRKRARFDLPRLASRVEPAVRKPAAPPHKPEPAAEPQVPVSQLLLVVHEVPRLDVEVRELPEEAPGEACATSAVQDVYGRVTQKEVKVSSSDLEPEVVLTGHDGTPSQTN